MNAYEAKFVWFQERYAQEQAVKVERDAYRAAPTLTKADLAVAA